MSTENHRDGYTISTDKARINIPIIHKYPTARLPGHDLQTQKSSV
jgi:hypothetical protein